MVTSGQPGVPDLREGHPRVHEGDRRRRADAREVLGRSARPKRAAIRSCSPSPSEETIKNLDRYKADLQALTDPRRTTEAQARQIIARAKPIYWLTSGVHSTERGGPEMLTELAYRLVVEETPFIQQIRNNVITFITPVVEVDGRERIVDTAYYNAKRQAEGLQGTLGLPYWGKYVAHDNNRDGMGQFLAMTKNVMKVANEWKPTILHDLHEAQQLLYASTGTGPYNEQLDPITIDEWWMFAQNDVMEMTKRGVPGVWTYGFYDGWTPNYMFYAVHTHNATGRFYEVGSYGVDNVTPRTRPGAPPRRRAAAAAAAARRGRRPRRRRPRRRAGAAAARRGGAGGAGAVAVAAAAADAAAATAASGSVRIPIRATSNWGPRAHVNMSQSAVLFALSFTGKDKERWLENYWIKNRNAVNRARTARCSAGSIPADAAQQGERGRSGQRPAWRRASSSTPRRQRVHRRQRQREAGRLDHPRRSAVSHGRRHLLRGAGLLDVEPEPVRRPRLDVSDDAQHRVARDQRQGAADGGDGAGDRRRFARPAASPAPARRSSSSTRGDNLLAQFRFQFASVKMSAAEAEFEAAGRKFGAGAFIIPNANRAQIEPVLTRARPLRLRRRVGAADGQDARSRRAAHRLHPQLGQHAGRRLGARRARLLQDSVHLLRRERSREAGPARASST